MCTVDVAYDEDETTRSDGSIENAQKGFLMNATEETLELRAGIHIIYIVVRQKA